MTTMAAVPLSRFRDFYTNMADPYGATPEVLQEAYAVGAVGTPALLMASTMSTAYPLAMLVCANGGRVYPILAPFDQSLLPGQGVPRKYALIGDLTMQGNLPPLVESTPRGFPYYHTPYHSCPTNCSANCGKTTQHPGQGCNCQGPPGGRSHGTTEIWY